MEKGFHAKALGLHVFVSMVDVRIFHQSSALECQSILGKGSAEAVFIIPGRDSKGGFPDIQLAEGTVPSLAPALPRGKYGERSPGMIPAVYSG
jgi:hypothetical protein